MTAAERLARLETQVEHLQESQTRIEGKLDAVVEAVTAARGGWKVVALLGPIASGIVAWVAAKFGAPKIV